MDFEPVAGVRINCTVSQKLDNRPIFESILVPQEIVDRLLLEGQSSQIARRIGTPLRAAISLQTKRCPGGPAMDWQYGIFLHLCCELETKEDSFEWGWATLWSNDPGDVIVIREDKEPLSARYLEILCVWCLQEMQPKFSIARGEFELSPRDNRKDVVALLTKENFEKYMDDCEKSGKVADYEWKDERWREERQKFMTEDENKKMKDEDEKKMQH